MQSRNGFSLIELMVVIAIIAIIAGIGAPSFRNLTLDNRLSSTANNLLGSLRIARSEAVTQRTAITVCATNTDNTDCADSANWTAGALLMRGSEVIRVIPGAASGLTIASSHAEVEFRPNGTITPTLLLTISEAERSKTHQVKVNAIGQACSGSACP
jgi:type II secretion system protein H